MRFYINPGDSVVSVDGYQIQPLTVSGLATNVKYVQWEEAALGLIVYNGEAPTFQPFSDPSPYQPSINAWMSSAAGLALTPALQATASIPLLTLAQAQQIKAELIEAIYDSKRQSAIQFAVSSGDAGYDAGVVAASPGGVYNWDCSDESLNAMSMALASAILSGTNSTVTGLNSSLVDAINGALSTLKGQINTALSSLATGINNALGSLLNNAANALQEFDNELNSGMQSTIGSLAEAFPNLANAINDAFSSLVSEINSALSSGFSQSFSQINSAIGSPNGGALQGTINYNVEQISSGNPQFVVTIPNITDEVSVPVAGVTLNGSANTGNSGWEIGSPGISSSGVGVSAPSIEGVSLDNESSSVLGSVQWIPIGQSAPVTMTGEEYSALVAAIVSRRASLNQSRQTLLASLAAKTTVSQVVSFDATAGWPF